MSGTGRVLGVVSAPVVAATVLPNTGGSAAVTFAVALGAGLAAWGLLYARVNR